MQNRNKRLGKRIVDTALSRATEYTIWDKDIAGFGLGVFPSGKKSYIFKYRVGGGRGGTLRKPLIGHHGALTPDQARAIASSWAAEVRSGGDPSRRRSRERQAPHMGALFDRYIEEHARLHKKRASMVADQRMIDRQIIPVLGRHKVAEVTRADISDLHQSLIGTPYEANRVLALLSKAFNLAELWGLRPDGSNPCRHVRKFREFRRERFLSQQELARLGDALRNAEAGKLVSRKGARLQPQAIGILRLLIFTGARKSEIRALKWSEVNLEASRLELEDSKTGAKHVYLPPPAAEILSNIAPVRDNPFVFVGNKIGTHIVNIEDAWRTVRAEAGLDNLRIHDLRHSFASVGAAGGISLQMIGALLGHREVATTARYAHLSADPMQAAANEIGRKIETALGAHQTTLHQRSR